MSRSAVPASGREYVCSPMGFTVTPAKRLAGSPPVPPTAAPRAVAASKVVAWLIDPAKGSGVPMVGEGLGLKTVTAEREPYARIVTATSRKNAETAAAKHHGAEWSAMYLEESTEAKTDSGSDDERAIST